MANAFVRRASATFNNSSTATATLASTTASGGLIVVFVGVTNGPTTINTPTDNSGGGNTYTAVDTKLGTVMQSTAFYAKNVTGGAAFAVTVTLTANSYGNLIIHEYSGADTTAPLDAHTVVEQLALGTGTDAITTGNLTPAANNEMFVGFMIDQGFGGPTVTVGTGFTDALGSNDNGVVSASEYFLQGTAAAKAVTFTHNAIGAVLVYGMTFKEQAAAGGGKPTTYYDQQRRQFRRERVDRERLIERAYRETILRKAA